MKQIIVSGISCIACGSVIAQSSSPGSNFSSQLKQLVNNAKNGFKTIPLDFKLKGALKARILHADDSSLYYHSVFASKMAVKNADNLKKQLAGRIKSALGNDYTSREKPRAYGIQEISFVNKNKSNFEEIILTTDCVLHDCNVYIDIFYEKKNRAENKNDSLYIEARVKRIIVDQLGVDETEVTPEASFTNDLGADSLDTVELVIAFEKEFNISIPDEDCESMTTVSKAVTYLKGRVK